MTEKITTGVLKFSAKDIKRLRKELENVAEFRNQITFDKQTFESHSRDCLKAVGEANYLLEFLQFIVQQNKISYTKKSGKITDMIITKRPKPLSWK